MINIQVFHCTETQTALKRSTGN